MKPQSTQIHHVLALVTLFAILFCGQLVAQIEPKISLVDRSTFRSTRYHPSGTEALSRFITNRMGGVLSQGTLDSSDETALFEGAFLTLPEGVDDYICIMVDAGSTCLRYDIEYSELVPLTMWVGSGATSAFTAVMDDHDDQFQRDAGFAPTVNGAIRGQTLAAIEFVGTSLEMILYYVDFCLTCTGSTDMGLVRRYNEHLSEDPFWQELLEGMEQGRDRESSYINADLDAVFSPVINDSELSLSGLPARYSWVGFVESDLRQIDEIAVFLESEDLVRSRYEEMRNETIRALAAMRVATAAVKRMDQPSELAMEMLDKAGSGLRDVINFLGIVEDRFDLAMHERGLWFFQTSSLLRYFMQTDSTRWGQFLREVQDRSDDIPEPWHIYATTYQDVYGRSPFPVVN